MYISNGTKCLASGNRFVIKVVMYRIGLFHLHGHGRESTQCVLWVTATTEGWPLSSGTYLHNVRGISGGGWTWLSGKVPQHFRNANCLPPLHFTAFYESLYSHQTIITAFVFCPTDHHFFSPPPPPPPQTAQEDVVYLSLASLSGSAKVYHNVNRLSSESDAELVWQTFWFADVHWI